MTDATGLTTAERQARALASQPALLRACSVAAALMPRLSANGWFITVEAVGVSVPLHGQCPDGSPPPVDPESGSHVTTKKPGGWTQAEVSRSSVQRDEQHLAIWGTEACGSSTHGD